MVWSSVYSVVCGIQGYVNKFIRVMWVQTWSNVCVYTHRDTHPYTVYVHIYIYYSHTHTHTDMYILALTFLLPNNTVWKSKMIK